MTNNQKFFFAKSLDIAKRLFLCAIFCLISNYVAAWERPSNVAKSITLQVGSSKVVDPYSAISGLPSHYISSGGLGTYDKKGLSITVASTKTVFNSASRKEANYYTYKILGNTVGTYTVSMGISYYYDDAFVKKNGSVSVTYTVNVVDVTSIDIPSNLSLKLGDQYKITPTLYPTGSQSTLKWSTTDGSVVSVQDGTITAKKCGTATIKCTASNGVYAQCAVTVSPVTVESITLNHSEYEILTNATDQLTAKILPANATSQSVKWTSSNEAVVLVSDNGLARAVAPGYAKVTATATDGSGVSASCMYHVSDPIITAESISFKEKTVNMEVGQSAALAINILPANTTNKNVNLSSSNPDCVSIAEDGTLTAVNVGTADITATTTDGSNLSTTCAIVVKPQNVNSFDNIVFFPKTKVTANSSVNLPLYLNNKNEISAVQFDLVLPKGITIGGNATINETGNRATNNSHTVGTSVQDNGNIRVLCYSPNLAVFTGTSGAILSIPLNIDENVENGSYYIQFKDIVLTEKDGQKHTISSYASEVDVTESINGDSNGDGSVDVADIVVIANHILGNTPANFIESAADVNGDGSIDVADIVFLANLLLHPQNARTSMARLLNNARTTTAQIDALEIAPFVLSEDGDSKTLTMDLYNTTEDFTAFQCDLYLPEGITVNKNKKGTSYKISFNEDTERTDASCHTLSAALQKDGAVRIICYSMNSDIFSGLSGALIDIPISSDASMANGFYDFSIKNVVLTHTDGTKVIPENYKGTVIVGDGGQEPTVAMYGRYTSEKMSEASEALSNNKNILSIDLSKAENIEDGASLTTGNPNTVIFVAENVSLSNANNVVVNNVCNNLKINDGFDFGTNCTFTAKNAEYARTMPTMDNGEKAKWGTIALPFALQSDEKVQYHVLSSVNDAHSVMAFEPIKNVEPGTPAVFNLLDDSGELTVTSNNTEIASTINVGETKANNWSMTGTYKGLNLDPLAADNRDKSIYYIADDSFWFANQQFEVSAFRGWFTTQNASVLSRPTMYAIHGGSNGTTGINGITSENGENNAVYNLSGMRIKTPSKGKINIINNKKVLVK